MKNVSILVIITLLISISGCLEENESGDVKINLYVSNQSGFDDPINITIYFDEELVFNETCWVEDSHNWIYVVFNATRGKHDIIVIENSNNVRNETRVNINSEKWVLIDYWYSPVYGNDQITRDITIHVNDKQVVFL